jgi:putative SOS response-associated peptidase YedK
MCGRFVSPIQAEMERYWELTDAQIRNPLQQRFNVAPTTLVPIIRRDEDGLEQNAARWGLIPFWWKQSKPPNFTFNTRIEEAATKPMWRIPLRESRCIVPAVGWYEWKEVEKTDPATGEIRKAKQPYFIHLPERQLVAFAGLLSSSFKSDSTEMELSCSILTKEAEGPAEHIHTRMTVVLADTAHKAWIDPEQTDAGKILEMARECSVSQVQYHLVSTRVNHSKNEGAELLDPFENPA